MFTRTLLFATLSVILVACDSSLPESPDPPEPNLVPHATGRISGGVAHADMWRTFILYVPDSYSSDTPAPVVFNFHGYSGTPEGQMWYGNFRPIADTAGFLIVHPRGTLLDGTSHWNVGGWTLGSNVNDVGFTEAMIDALADAYTIDEERIYSTGMSNGGYMSFELACQLSDRIAAIASVTGSMTPETYNDCAPDHPTPILQIHGTSDAVVPYAGAIWSRPIDLVIDYWRDYNGLEITPLVDSLPDIDAADGSTVEHIIYNGHPNSVTVEHFRIRGGGHTWPGAEVNDGETNQDFSASVEIWKFFSQYRLSTLAAGS